MCIITDTVDRLRADADRLMLRVDALEARGGKQLEFARKEHDEAERLLETILSTPSEEEVDNALHLLERRAEDIRARRTYRKARALVSAGVLTKTVVYEEGDYHVPSASDPGRRYLVDTQKCQCPSYGFCWHQALSQGIHQARKERAEALSAEKEELHDC